VSESSSEGWDVAVERVESKDRTARESDRYRERAGVGGAGSLRKEIVVMAVGWLTKRSFYIDPESASRRKAS
jgi:hypothetical protein